MHIIVGRLISICATPILPKTKGAILKNSSYYFESVEPTGFRSLGGWVYSKASVYSLLRHVAHFQT